MRSLHVGRLVGSGPGELVRPAMPHQDIYRTHCVACGTRFTEANVWSDAGWLETQISGLCESCFDAVASLFELTARDEDGKPIDEEPGAGG